MAAEVHCLDAWEHGWQAEANEICAWAMDAKATIAMYSQRATIAREAAMKGLKHAPRGSASAIRVSAQLARAFARLGQADHFTETLRATRQQLEQLAQQDAGLFSADAGRLASYAASSYIWLRQPKKVVPYAKEAITFYSQAVPEDRSPTRQAITRLDLGLAFIRLGSPDNAADEAWTALSCDRLTGSVLSRLHDLTSSMQVSYPTLAATSELSERYEALVRTFNRPPLSNP